MSDEERDIYEDLTSYVPDGGSSGPISGVKVYDGGSYFITVRLSDITGSTIMTVEDDDTGKDVMGVFIPIRQGGLTLTPKKNVLLVCKATMAQVVNNGFTHLLTQIVDRDVEAENRRMGFKQGFIGKMRPSGFRKKNKKS